MLWQELDLQDYVWDPQLDFAATITWVWRTEFFLDCALLYVQ